MQIYRRLVLHNVVTAVYLICFCRSTRLPSTTGVQISENVCFWCWGFGNSLILSLGRSGVALPSTCSIGITSLPIHFIQRHAWQSHRNCVRHSNSNVSRSRGHRTQSLIYILHFGRFQLVCKRPIYIYEPRTQSFLKCPRQPGLHTHAQQARAAENGRAQT